MNFHCIDHHSYFSCSNLIFKFLVKHLDYLIADIINIFKMTVGISCPDKPYIDHFDLIDFFILFIFTAEIIIIDFEFIFNLR